MSELLYELPIKLCTHHVIFYFQSLCSNKSTVLQFLISLLHIDIILILYEKHITCDTCYKVFGLKKKKTELRLIMRENCFFVPDFCYLPFQHLPSFFKICTTVPIDFFSVFKSAQKCTWFNNNAHFVKKIVLFFFVRYFGKCRL